MVLTVPIVGAVVASGFAEEPGLRYATAAFAVLFAVLAACFGTLTVRDAGDHLDVRFGPIPLFGTRVRYDAIEGFAAARSRLIDGWGVHWIPGRGWTFNLWGFDCVEISTGKGTVRIGTDDPDGLAAFLAARSGLHDDRHGVGRAE